MKDHPFTNDAVGRLALRLLILGGLRRWNREGGKETAMPAAEWERILLSHLDVLQAATVVLVVLHESLDSRANEYLGYPRRGAAFMRFKSAARILKRADDIEALLAETESHHKPKSRGAVKSARGRERMRRRNTVEDNLGAVGNALTAAKFFDRIFDSPMPPKKAD